MSMTEYPLLEVAVRSRSIEPHSIFLMKKPVYDSPIARDALVGLVRRCYSEAATVHRIHKDVHRLETSGRQYFKNDPE